MKLESNHGSSNGRCCFDVFRIFVKKFVIHFVISKTMIRGECLGLVKHIYLIQIIILIRLLWLSGISKICVSFADKYSCKSAITLGLSKAIHSCKAFITVGLSKAFHICKLFITLRLSKAIHSLKIFLTRRLSRAVHSYKASITLRLNKELYRFFYYTQT